MTPKVFFVNIFDISVLKNAEFDANFESVEKVSRKFTPRKLEAENDCSQFYELNFFQLI